MPPWENSDDNGSLSWNEVTVSIEFNGDTQESTIEFSGANIDISYPFRRESDTDMRYATQEAWAFDTLLEYEDAEYVGSAWTGNENEHNGYIGILIGVVGRGADEVREQLSESDESFSVVFNDITKEWPWEMRTTLAAYIAARDSEDYSTSIVDDLTEFAQENDRPIETEGAVLAGAERTDRGDGGIYDDDPFNDPGLDESEATFVLAARLHGMDDDEIDLDAIDNVDAMVSTLLKSGDYEYAIRAQYYGPDVPRFAVANRDRPDSWEQLSKQEAIEGESCEVCGRAMFEGEYEGEVVTVREGGEVQSGRVVQTEDDTPLNVVGPYESFICPTCSDEIKEGIDVPVATYISDDGEVATVRWKQGVFYDEGEATDDRRVPIRETRNGVDVLQFLAENGGRVPWEHWQRLQPSPEYGNPPDQEERIGWAAEGSFDEVRGAPIIFHGGAASGVYIDLGDQSSVAWGKAVIEGRDTV